MNAEVRPGYKLTGLGVIPHDWEIYNFEELSDFVTSGSRGWARYYSKSGALFIRSQNIKEGRLDLLERQFVNPPRDSEGSRTRVSVNDILITITGNSVGNVAIVSSDLGESYISQHVGLIRLRNPLPGRYICWFLSPFSVGNNQISGSQSGQSKPGLNLKNLRDFLIALPPEKEQHAIANALDDTDALISRLDQLIAKKRDIQQATMQQLLTGQRRLPRFSGEWEVKRLGEVVEIQKGQLITEKLTIFGAIPVIAGGKKPAYFHNVANRSGKNITISASGASAGYVAFFETPLFASDCSTIGESDNYEILYVYYSLKVRQEEIYKAQTGGAQPHIHPADLYPLLVAWPDKAEQTAIATILSDMDTELVALEARRDKTRQIKQGMMQELLTGKTRLL